MAVVPEGAKLLLIAGQIGNLKNGEILEGLEVQHEQALANINSIIASEHTLDINPPMLPTQATSNELIEIIVDLAEDVTALQERVDRLENQSDVIPESKKKNNWLRFDSKRRSSN